MNERGIVAHEQLIGPVYWREAFNLNGFNWIYTIVFCHMLTVEFHLDNILLGNLNNWNLIRNSFESKLITEIESWGFCLVRGEWQVVLFPNSSSSPVRSNSNSAQWQCLHREHMPLLLVLWFELQLVCVKCFSQGKSTKKLDLIAPFALAFIATTTEQSSLPFTSLEFLFQTLELN